MTRSQFLQRLGVLAGSLFASRQQMFSSWRMVPETQERLTRVREIIASYAQERTTLIRSVRNGRKYRRNPYRHYPWQGGIYDTTTGYRIFFHAHRRKEFGHFHTFAENADGDPIHLVMISMTPTGEPTMLATLNGWVTDDVNLPGEELKKYLVNFSMDRSLFTDPRIIEFITEILKGYQDTIFELFDERDAWVARYRAEHGEDLDPFEDDTEVLSYRKIDVQNG